MSMGNGALHRYGYGIAVVAICMAAGVPTQECVGQETSADRAVSLSDAAISVAQGRLSDRCSLTDFAGLVRKTDAGDVWTKALQTALDRHEIVSIPRTGSPYLIDSPIVIPSNRRIEASGAVVRLAPHVTTVMLRTSSALDGTLKPLSTNGRVDNIAIVGGRWEDNSTSRRGYGRSGRYNLGERKLGNFYGVSTLFYFGRANHVLIQDVTFARCGGFAIQAGDGYAHRYENIFFEDCYADGLHLNGNLENVHARGLRGKVGDDLVALNAYDWLDSSVNFGPQRNIVCEDLHLLLKGGRGYPAIRIQPAQYRYNDGSIVDCAIFDVVFRHVRGIRTFKMFLKEFAYDFMKGAMNVYLAMLEDVGRALAIPLGPSPEWMGSDFKRAVGRNPSFQLAACHRLAQDLLDASKMLGVQPDMRWLDVRNRLPAYSHFDGVTGDGVVWGGDVKGGIAIFEGVNLHESHRHHSHMAGIYPFDTILRRNGANHDLIDSTYANWVLRGTGMWTGWCVPWAAILQVDAGNARAAVSYLHAWNDYFCDEGHGSHHNSVRDGFTNMRHGRNVMQMDGQCATVSAILEMMAHEINGKVEFFRGCPAEWTDVSFENLALSDGSRVRGRRVKGKITMVGK